MLSTQEYILWVVTVLTGFSNGQFPDTEYCGILCPQEQQHTMCAYKPVGPNCQNVKSLMNEEGRMKILSLHNSLRNALASGQLKDLPVSSNMRQLYWDIELEAIAERWALQCNASFNDDCRNVNRFKVGQIMSKSNIMTTNDNYYEALLTKLWFPEMKNLKEDIINNYRMEKNVKHIAQILSANTMRIGCADVQYKTASDVKSVRVTICNYGPMITDNEQIYRIGDACSECPQQTECRGDAGKYSHLCNELRLFDVVELEKSVGTVKKEYQDYDTSNVDVGSRVLNKERGYIKNRRNQHILGQKPSKTSSDVVRSGARAWDDNAGDGGYNEDSDDEDEEKSGNDSEKDGKGTTEDDKGDAKEGNVSGEDDEKGGKTEGKGTTAHMDVLEPSSEKPADGDQPKTNDVTVPRRNPRNSEQSLKPADVVSHLIGHAIIAVTTVVLQR